MTDPVFRGDIPVTLVEYAGSDRQFAHAAWVAPPGGGPAPGRDDTPAGWRRVIEAMMRGRHSAPFEHGLMTVHVEAPAVVWWEWTRHRFMSLGPADHSFSLESGRYRVLDGVFYRPPDDRPVREPAGFRPMRPGLEPGSESDVADIRTHLTAAARAGWDAYTALVGVGIAREVARLALPYSVYYAGYVSANPLTWLTFFRLRTRAVDAAAPSYPQWEIEQAALECEALFQTHWPVTHAAWMGQRRAFP